MLQFELVSPEKVLVAMKVSMAVVPGSEGDYGVLPQHAPMMTLVRPGIVSLYDGDEIVKRLFVAGGFAEVNETSCTLLAEDAIPVEDIDRAAAEQAISDLVEDLADAEDDASKTTIQKRLTIAEAKRDAAASR
jgi:F-type H+-transporting ATPase subunit epsilon